MKYWDAAKAAAKKLKAVSDKLGNQIGGNITRMKQPKPLMDRYGNTVDENGHIIEFAKTKKATK